MYEVVDPYVLVRIKGEEVLRELAEIKSVAKTRPCNVSNMMHFNPGYCLIIRDPAP